MKHPKPIVFTATPLISAAALAALLTISGCADSDADQNASATEYDADTSYLDDLARDQGIEEEADPEPAEETRTAATEEEDPQYQDEDREWIAEEGSRSILGRSRDRARDVGEQIQGSTEPENGLANTIREEEYAQAAGFAWDMPEDWRMAVPSQGHFAEMFIKHQLGNASVVFSKTTESAQQTRRTLESSITDTFGAGSTKTSTRQVMGHAVTVFDLQGTYIDPAGKGGGNGNPFYAIHAVLIELPTTNVLIKMWGPQDTVDQNAAKFDKMIDNMYSREP